MICGNSCWTKLHVVGFHEEVEKNEKELQMVVHVYTIVLAKYNFLKL